MTIEQMFVPGVIAAMAIFMVVLGTTAWFTRD
jgi:hypothetical protein